MNNVYYAVIHDFGIYIKVFSQLYNHNISVTHIIFLETCSYCYSREPSKTKVLSVFLVITTSQSFTSITNCNHFT